MRPALFPLALLAFSIAACAEDATPTDLTLTHYSRDEPNRAVTIDFDTSAGRLTLTEGASSSVRTATLSAEGRAQLDDAMAEVEAAWNPPYACAECLNAEVYRFDSDHGPQMLMNYYLNPQPFMAPLRTVLDELTLELRACAGPWIQQCFEQP